MKIYTLTHRQPPHLQLPRLPSLSQLLINTTIHSSPRYDSYLHFVESQGEHFGSRSIVAVGDGANAGAMRIGKPRVCLGNKL